MDVSTPKLAAALARVQAELPTLERDREVTVTQKSGATYSYSYVTLAKLSEVVLPLLAKHGLAFTALPGTGPDGKMALRYRLMHESGEALEGQFPISGEGGIQMIGGRITYARRYCLAAVVGVAADEDDESRLAEGPRTAQRAGLQEQREVATAQRSTAARPAGPPPLPGEEGQGITKPQQAKLGILFQRIGWTDRDDRLRASSALVGRPLASSGDLSKAEASALIDRLEQVAADPDPAQRLTDLVAAATTQGGEG